MAFWYAAIVKRSREGRFADYLAAAGFIAYVPREEKRVLIKHKPKRYEMRPRPIIRGLVLIGAAADLAEDAYAWQAVAAVPFYKGLFGSGGVPRRISQREIEAMEHEAEKLGRPDLRAGFPRLKVGDDTRMKLGAFEGLRATVKELHGRRALVLISILGGEREIDVDAMALEPWAAE